MAAPEPLAKLSGILTLASIAVVTGALYLAKGVLVPLTLAVLLSFLLSPVCDRLERWRFGRIPAVLVTALLAFTMLGVVAWMAVVQMNNLAPKMPEYQDNIQAKLHSTNDYVGGLLSKITRTTENQAPKPVTLSAGRRAAKSRRASLLGSRDYHAAEPLAGHHGNVRHAARRAGLDRHRHRACRVLPGPARGLARSIHPSGRKRRRDGDHPGDRRCRHAGQPIPLDAACAQRHVSAWPSPLGCT